MPLSLPLHCAPHTWVSDRLNRGVQLSCGIRVSVEPHKLLCQHTAVGGLRIGASSSDLCTVVKYKSTVKLADIYSFTFYALSGHAVFFLTNAGQLFVGVKSRSLVVEFLKYLLK